VTKVSHILLLIALVASPNVLRADSVNGTVNDVLSFRPAPTSRGPASVTEEVPATIEPEIADVSTEAGFCLECSRLIMARSKSLATQSREILDAIDGRHK
jgi:hypothetical protein